MRAGRAGEGAWGRASSGAARPRGRWPMRARAPHARSAARTSVFFQMPPLIWILILAALPRLRRRRARGAAPAVCAAVRCLHGVRWRWWGWSGQQPREGGAVKALLRFGVRGRVTAATGPHAHERRNTTSAPGSPPRHAPLMRPTAAAALLLLALGLHTSLPRCDAADAGAARSQQQERQEQLYAAAMAIRWAAGQRQAGWKLPFHARPRAPAAPAAQCSHPLSARMHAGPSLQPQQPRSGSA